MGPAKTSRDYQPVLFSISLSLSVHFETKVISSVHNKLGKLIRGVRTSKTMKGHRDLPRAVHVRV